MVTGRIEYILLKLIIIILNDRLSMKMSSSSGLPPLYKQYFPSTASLQKNHLPHLANQQSPKEYKQTCEQFNRINNDYSPKMPPQSSYQPNYQMSQRQFFGQESVGVEGVGESYLSVNRENKPKIVFSYNRNGNRQKASTLTSSCGTRQQL